MSSTARAADGPTRRGLLMAGPVLLMGAACTADSPRPAPPRPTPAPVDPDDALRRAAAERERAVLREYDAVLAALPDLAARLQPLRGHHVEHLEALAPQGASASPSSADGGSGAGSSSGRPSGGPSGGPSGAPSGGPPPVPPAADRAGALRRLVAVERSAGLAHARDCLTASRALAAVLASLSASELSHPVALT